MRIITTAHELPHRRLAAVARRKLVYAGRDAACRPAAAISLSDLAKRGLELGDVVQHAFRVLVQQLALGIGRDAVRQAREERRADELLEAVDPDEIRIARYPGSRRHG